MNKIKISKSHGNKIFCVDKKIFFLLHCDVFSKTFIFSTVRITHYISSLHTQLRVKEKKGIEINFLYQIEVEKRGVSSFDVSSYRGSIKAAFSTHEGKDRKRKEFRGR